MLTITESHMIDKLWREGYGIEICLRANHTQSLTLCVLFMFGLLC